MSEQINYYRAKLAYEMDPSDLFKLLETSNEYIVVDTRATHGFEKEHIPNAMNLPHQEMTEASTTSLDKTKIYVCYCDGIGCNASTKGALKMAQLGFKVMELIGGLEWWKFDGYATAGIERSEGLDVTCAC